MTCTGCVPKSPLKITDLGESVEIHSVLSQSELRLQVISLSYQFSQIVSEVYILDHRHRYPKHTIVHIETPKVTNVISGPISSVM